LEQGLLLLELLLLSRIEVYWLAVRTHDLLHVRHLAQLPRKRASLAHSWCLVDAHLPTERCRLEIRRSIRHPGCTAMALLAPLSRHVMRRLGSHLGWIHVDSRSGSWRTSADTRRRVLHWDITHIIYWRHVTLRSAISNNGG
jgi:hypothetical protein